METLADTQSRGGATLVAPSTPVARHAGLGAQAFPRLRSSLVRLYHRHATHLHSPLFFLTYCYKKPSRKRGSLAWGMHFDVSCPARLTPPVVQHVATAGRRSSAAGWRRVAGIAVGQMERRRNDALHAEGRCRKITQKLRRTHHTWRGHTAERQEQTCTRQ
jgi:hypothetical protein